MWRDTADRFAAALADPALSVPKDLTGNMDRFDVYRNNVAVGARDALAATFPVTRMLVGEDFFNAMAGLFVRMFPPASPVMIEYGGEFPDFIAAFEPVRTVPYLADVARLEWAWNESYNAADADTLAIDVLAGRTGDQIDRTRFRLHPTLRLVSSNWPVASVWQAHQGNEEPEMSAFPDDGERVLIVRPHMEVTLHRVTPHVFSMVQRFGRGEPLGAVLNDISQDGDVDPSMCLAELFDVGAVVDAV